MTNPENAGQLYQSAKPFLDAALADYAKWLDSGLSAIITDFYVAGRVKAARSLIRKMRKTSGNPRSWESIQDKVGLRVICSTKTDVGLVDKWLCTNGTKVLERTVKTGDHDRLFYPGVHFVVENVSIKGHDGHPIPCEIQIRTRAQDAWSVVSHKLLYKGLIEPPNRIKRVISRLTIVVEMFDDEVQRMMKKRRRLPIYRPATMLESLDQRYESIVGEPSLGLPDLDLMLVLVHAYSADEVSHFDDLIAEYCSTSGTDLVDLIESHQPSDDAYLDSRDWLYTQPEILLVLERAATKPYLLADAIRDTDIEDVVRGSCISAGTTLPAQ